MPNLNIFHKSGAFFLIVALVLCAAYFLLAAGNVNITSEGGGRSRFRKALRRICQFAVFFAVVSWAGLMPKPIEQKAEAMIDALGGMVGPVARKLPLIGSLF